MDECSSRRFNDHLSGVKAANRTESGAVSVLSEWFIFFFSGLRCVQSNIVLLTQAFRKKFVIPDFLSFCAHIDDLYDTAKPMSGGQVRRRTWNFSEQSIRSSWLRVFFFTAGRRLHSPARSLQPRPLGRRSVHRGRTEVTRSSLPGRKCLKNMIPKLIYRGIYRKKITFLRRKMRATQQEK